MAVDYEILALRLPPGADVEEAAEALSVRLAASLPVVSTDAGGRERREATARRVRIADPRLARPAAGAETNGGAPLRLTDGVGVRVDVGDDFVRWRVGLVRDAEAAAGIFDGVFRALTALAGEWQFYDPQRAASLAAGEDCRASTLELYLSVVDHVAREASG